jgi:hypothetical protein
MILHDVHQRDAAAEAEVRRGDPPYGGCVGTGQGAASVFELLN